MSGNTGLLTARCDPYGAESSIRLLGGMYPESWTGRLMWHCEKRADARYRMICTGGEYGERTAPGGVLMTAHHCDGGHQGQPMPLCTDHRREIQRRQASLCPACAWPPKARTLQEQSDEIQILMASHRGNYPVLAALAAQLDQVTAAFNDMLVQGIVHKCPLKLVEIS